MKHVSYVAVVAAMVFGLSLSAAAGINGKVVKVTGGSVASVSAPVSVPCDAKSKAPLAVVETETGKVMPATLANGQLTFVVDALAAGATKTYTVKTGKKSAADAPRVNILKRGKEAILDVYVDGVLFTSYYYSNDNRKPYLWPLNTSLGTTITRDWPMGPAPNEKAKDHVHHKSMWCAYGDINGSDFWGETTKNAGYQVSGEVTFGGGDAYGWIRAKNVWESKEHKPVIGEQREYRFYATPESGRLIDVAFSLSADYGDAFFKDTKEGGLVALRMRPEITADKAFITNSLGDKGEKTLWGKPAAWCDYSGELDGFGWFGAAIFDNPANFRYPTSWHTRAYGLTGANPFGYKSFNSEAYNKGLIPENGDYTLKSGEKLNMNYRVFVHAGDVSKAAVADRWADYATPPKAAWAK